MSELGAEALVRSVAQAVPALDTDAGAACARLLNVGTNLAALLYFGARGQVLLMAGGAMAVCNIAGAVCGAHLAVRYGSGLVRRIFIVVVIALIAKTAWNAFHV